MCTGSFRGERSFSSLCEGAEGSGAQAGQHRSSACREKLGMKLKLSSKGRGQELSPDPALFILTGEEDDDDITAMITGQGEEAKAEEESFSPLPTVPLTCHHLCCQGSSARLAAAGAPINHCSAGQREVGVDASAACLH